MGSSSTSAWRQSRRASARQASGSPEAGCMGHTREARICGCGVGCWGRRQPPAVGVPCGPLDQHAPAMGPGCWGRPPAAQSTSCCCRCLPHACRVFFGEEGVHAGGLARRRHRTSAAQRQVPVPVSPSAASSRVLLVFARRQQSRQEQERGCRCRRPRATARTPPGHRRRAGAAAASTPPLRSALLVCASWPRWGSP